LVLFIIGINLICLRFSHRKVFICFEYKVEKVTSQRQKGRRVYGLV